MITPDPGFRNVEGKWEGREGRRQEEACEREEEVSKREGKS